MESRVRNDAERRLFLVSAIVILSVMFAGFARSYYLSAWLSKRVLTPVLHFHGLIMTAWVVLFFIQTFLVARHRVDLHRKLGPWGAVLGLIVSVVGAFVIVQDINRQAPGAGRPVYLKMLVAFDGLHLLSFAGLVLIAVIVRRRSDVHKRLMLLATVSLLPPAFGRFVARFVALENVPVVVLVLMTASTLAAILIDSARNRRLQPAFGWGGALVIGSTVLTYFAQVSG